MGGWLGSLESPIGVFDAHLRWIDIGIQRGENRT